MAEERAQILETVSMDLLSIPPLVSRSLRKRVARAPLGQAETHMTPHHFEIMRLLEEEGSLSASEIGDRLQLAKAQMTKLIDRLVASGIVERTCDPADRRVYDIRLTEQSRAILEEHRKKVVQAMQDIISRLSDRELENVSNSLRSLRDLLVNSSCETQTRL
jgi:DNA-binding MarR family transcriptional regulator